MNGVRIFVVLFVAISSSAFARDDWAIDIAPSFSWDDRASITLDQPFSVVLTNQTNHNLTMCNDSFYGGENDLAFLCTLTDGKKFTLRTESPMLMASDIPELYVVHSGGHYVITVHLKNQGGLHWTIDPERKKMDLSPLFGARDVTVVAIFSHSTDERGTIDVRSKNHVWNGEVRSKPIKLMFLKLDFP